jgi:hypothetical protein
LVAAFLLAIQVRTPQGIHDVLNREINRLYWPILRLTDWLAMILLPSVTDGGVVGC